MGSYKPSLRDRLGRRIRIPTRNRPFPWGELVKGGVSLLAIALSLLVLLKAMTQPTVTQWWRERTLSEGKPRPVPNGRQGKSDYLKIGFEALAAFEAETTRLSGSAPIVADVPKSIQALDGRRVSVVGFMIPMLMDKDRVLSFILAQSRTTCCYGVVPKVNQWIYVRMDGDRTTSPTLDVPVTVSGTLSVGEEFDKQNRGWCLYRMASDKVEIPRSSWF